MSRNGNRPGEGAANSVGKSSKATELTRLVDFTQATPTGDSRVPSGSREGRVEWLRGVAADKRITVVHRLALIGLGLHRVAKARAEGGLGSDFIFGAKRQGGSA